MKSELLIENNTLQQLYDIDQTVIYSQTIAYSEQSAESKSLRYNERVRPQLAITILNTVVAWGRILWCERAFFWNSYTKTKK